MHAAPAVAKLVVPTVAPLEVVAVVPPAVGAELEFVGAAPVFGAVAVVYTQPPDWRHLLEQDFAARGLQPPKPAGPRPDWLPGRPARVPRMP